MDDWSFYDPLTLSEAATTPDSPYILWDQNNYQVALGGSCKNYVHKMRGIGGPKRPFLTTFRVKISTQKLVGGQ